ncbi:MAG: hypothetical protein PHI15_05895 [Methanomicrobium sp.]|nr:hypothetical protein [Methanomicrobium sp.]
MITLGDSIDKKDIFMVFSDAENLKEDDINIVSQLVKLNYETIVITSNQPYSNLVRTYEAKDIDLLKNCVHRSNYPFCNRKSPGGRIFWDMSFYK